MKTVLVTTAKNEGPYFLEWIAYHRLIGFDDIIVFQNDSDDETDSILKVLRRLGVIQYFYNKAMVGNHQNKAYIRASRNPAYLDADWAMALDMDEFLLVRVGDGTVTGLIDFMPDVHSIYINWRIFGSSGHQRLAPGFVTERFTWAERRDLVIRNVMPFKALFKPRFYDRPGIHRPSRFKGEPEEMRMCNGAGAVSPNFRHRNFQCSDASGFAHCQINHYMIRDAQSFVLKSARGSAHQTNRTVHRGYWLKQDRNREQDTDIAAFAPRIQALIDAWDEQASGRLKRLHQRALRIHNRKFRALMEQPEYRELYDYCVEVSKDNMPDRQLEDRN